MGGVIKLFKSGFAKTPNFFNIFHFKRGSPVPRPPEREHCVCVCVFGTNVEYYSIGRFHIILQHNPHGMGGFVGLALTDSFRQPRTGQQCPQSGEHLPPAGGYIIPVPGCIALQRKNIIDVSVCVCLGV